VVAGTTYQKTRRSVRRRFFFRPSAITNQIILYSLAHAAWKHGVGVHWIAMMSTHDHDGVSDRLGNLPDFLRDYHRDVAMALRRVLGIAETVWSDAPTSAVELLNEAAQCQAAVYAITNPVAAGLVFSAAEWPGLITLPGCRELVVRRPDVYFSKDRPDELRLRITPPPAWSGSEDEWHSFLAVRVAERERELAAERRREGRAVLGRVRVLQRDPFDGPREEEVEKKGNPVLAAGGDTVLLMKAKAALRWWLDCYRSCRRRWTEDKSAGFPMGTWWVVQYAGARIDD